MDLPLMPKATAVWLVENTILTFDQIAAFCGLHGLEVKGIADGDVAQGIIGADPVASHQLTQQELDLCAADPARNLVLSKPNTPLARRRGPRYTPVSRRQDRPDAISWLLRYHPELTDGQVCKLVGTTKPTINAVRERTHWNAPNIKPNDPVALGLCSQIDLDDAVQKAERKAEREANKSNTKGKSAKQEATVVATGAAAAKMQIVKNKIVPASRPARSAAAALDSTLTGTGRPEDTVDLSKVFETPPQPVAEEPDNTDTPTPDPAKSAG